MQPSWMQRLTVLGRFSDGSIRNLGRKVVYSPSDPTVEVTADGKIEMRSNADVAVMVRAGERLPVQAN